MQRVDLVNTERKKTEPVSIDIELSSQFIDMVKNNSIPINYNIYYDIRSALTSDLYVWLIYRNHGVISNNGLFISRRALLEQFGENNIDNERERYSRILQSVNEIKKKYFEELKYDIIDRGSTKDKGIVLYKSPVFVDDSDLKYMPIMGF
jgi:hypothetical protein